VPIRHALAILVTVWLAACAPKTLPVESPAAPGSTAATASAAPITITQRNPNTKDSSIARRISWCISGFTLSGMSIAASFID